MGLEVGLGRVREEYEVLAAAVNQYRVSVRNLERNVDEKEPS